MRMPRAKFVLAAAGAGLFARDIVTAPASAAQYEFRWASSLAVDHPSSVRGKQMCAAIERESDGRIKMPFFPNSQLGGNLALIAQLRVGAIQFITMSAGDLNSVVPAVDITNIGYAFKNTGACFHAVDGSLGDYLQREIAAKGMVAMRTVWDSGMRQITSSSHPIRTVDDLSGFKPRVVESRIIVDLFKTLGANPTPISSNEVYTALQTRVVDGCDFPLASIEAFRFYEVQKFLSLTSHNWSCLWAVANADAWKSLPADLQAVVERNARTYALLERRDATAINSATADKLARQGLKVNTPDATPFRARLGAYYAKWATEFGPAEWGLLQSAIGGKLG